MTTAEYVDYLIAAASGDGTLPDVGNFYGNEFHSPDENDYLFSEDPALGLPWAKIADSTVSDAEKAISAAVEAFPAWSATSVTVRAALLNKVADILEPLSYKLAVLESKDQGKTITTAKEVDIPRCLHNFRAFGTSILNHTSTSTIQSEPISALNIVTHDAVGPAVLICPWNLPLYLLSFKLAPALACGNTVIAKPSEMTSVTASVLAVAFKEAGAPPGVVNFIFGRGQTVGDYLVKSPAVKLVSFTGSTAVGKQIAIAAATTNKKVSLEMGGKNAAVVFPSVDIPDTVATLARSCFANQGEICLCTERLYVHADIYDTFLDQFVRETRKWQVGDPKDAKSRVGALISQPHFEKVNSYFKLAKSTKNAVVHCGGPVQLPELQKGYFFAPTVVSNVADDSKLLTEEIFGPFVVVSPFKTTEEVIRKANSGNYGLSASILSQNIDEVTTVARALKVGTVWANCWMVRDLRMPFGGTKESGSGRDGTAGDSLDFYSEKKTICIKFGQA
uniref:Aldedh domain-containing protein n=1 Tax=Panagrellus redivivus TaxID=6233 RepID=A0A7E4VA51_PANRE